ncbi:heat-inducible transcription repressor HrcA [Oxobacter pfennigii]|uniref:Heat-inducible transcription repressor HrcA n=1 Tax=Oxobacter pfennigii TaxID=36849 RepID=A0A0P8X054_9CLOT|nr:heat-inducible transcriptional repressor HrcA [Oxobacter pfennigii]KPU44127.1 heat-inducible transcription repressor HrcA [Oxobacter pfennigii]
MDLDERKRQVLKVLISDYITTAEPVGSRTIAKRYGLGISSATIRNEMADLEDMGYLEQPHTSAGRIPSDKGYRVYVDHLMNAQKLTKEEIDLIQNSIYKAALGEIDKIIKETSKVLSILTNYTTLVTSPQAKKSSVKHIQLIAVDSMNVVVIVVTNFGTVKNSMVKLSQPITSEKLATINNILNDKLKGLTIEEINLNIISDVQRNVVGYNEIFNEIIPILCESLNIIDDGDIYLEGSSNIFNYPEYNAIDKAKAFLSVLDKKDFLYKLLSSEDENTKIFIGHENEHIEIKDCSLITTTYKIGDNVVGSIGIIGPTRMYYSKVLAILQCFRSYLNDALTSYYNDK